MDVNIYDIVVIGAGVAGSMTALLAAREGLRTLLVERHTFPRHKVCGCCLNGRAVSMLKEARLWSGLLSLAPNETSSLAVRCRGSKLDLPMPQNVAVSRYKLDYWLSREAVAAGAELRENTLASVVPLGDEIALLASPGVSGQMIAQDKPNSQPSLRHIELKPATDGGSSSVVAAKTAVVCDGLGHPSLSRLTRFQAQPVPGARIGLGAVITRTNKDAWIDPHAILMAVAPHGYVGVVEIEEGQLDLAAAVDASNLNATKSPLKTLQAIFESAGIECPDGLSSASIKGTVPLTRAATHICGHRLLLLGDSTGYVEPFTGEGMAWALTAATAVVPVLKAGVREWTTQLETQWTSTFRQIVRREQTICRMLSSALRRSWVLPPLMMTCRMFPSFTQQLVRQINRVPQFAH